MILIMLNCEQKKHSKKIQQNTNNDSFQVMCDFYFLNNIFAKLSAQKKYMKREDKYSNNSFNEHLTIFNEGELRVRHISIRPVLIRHGSCLQ